MITILGTKLHIPLAPANLVPRSKLIERLNKDAKKKLVLVSAPAGYGKTTLISQWSSSVPLPFAWLTLDEGDNDLTRFAHYLVASLSQTKESLVTTTKELLQRSSPHIWTIPSPSLLVTHLISDVLTSDVSFVLVLDDYQTINDKTIHEAVKLLVEQMSPEMLLVIITREDPPLPLARLRSRDELVEIRQQDLRFESIEIAQYFEHTRGLKLSRENIALMERRTEGWIAGIQLAAIALGNRQDLDAFMRSFAGDHRYIMDYLVDEVLSWQSEEVRFFLLVSAILDRLSCDICSALTDGEISPSRCQEILEYLERANLFIVPLDSRHHWYRYHSLLSQALRQQVRLTMPESLAQLNQKASSWFENNGFHQDAVDYALKAGDMSRAAQLIEASVPRMAYLGMLANVARWLEELPAPIIKSRPWLSLARAWLLFRSGHIVALRFALQETESALEGYKLSDGDQIAGQVAIIKGTVAGIMGRMEEATELLGNAVFALPEQDLTARSHGQLILASCLSWHGEFDWALSVYSKALSASRHVNYYGVMFDTLGDRARLESWMGRLKQAAITCQEALRISSEHYDKYGWQPPETGYIFVRYSTILCEWNERERALHYARKGIELCERWGQQELLIRCYMDVADVLNAFDQPDEALSYIQKAKELANNLTPWYVARTSAKEALLFLSLGNLDPVYDWTLNNQHLSEEQLRFELMECYLALAKILVAIDCQTNKGDYSPESDEFLERILLLFESVGAAGCIVEARVLQAMDFLKRRDAASALESLKQALVLAEPEGYTLLFVKEGESMAQLLKQLAITGFMPEYIGHLLTHSSLSIASQSLSLPTPLTEREVEVLRLIVAGLTNREIAEELVVSMGTVKTHINHIYQKLDVHSRTQAAALAREHNLT